jgi:putative tryptophan/tyrosine transport system substrate-binding protein
MGQMTIDIGRRKFVAAFGGATVGLPLAARAQQVGKLPIIGFLGPATAAAWSQWFAAFTQRLRELGWIEGRTVTIESRWTEGRAERLAEIATELAELKVDIIVTGGPPAVLAAKHAAPATPIVFAISADAVGTGLVNSLARPGGNVTGLSVMIPNTVGKRLELLRQIVPELRRLAVMANVGFTETLLEREAVQSLAKTLGLDITTLEIRRSDDIAPAFAQLDDRAQALYVCPDPLMIINIARISALAISAKLPAIYGTRDYVEAGGLMSYGPNFRDLFSRSAELVDKILRGTKPADIPVEQPTKFNLVINLNTAKALGLTIPHNLLVLADEVIE